MIEVKNLDKSYGKLHVLKGVSLNVQKGEKLPSSVQVVPENQLFCDA